MTSNARDALPALLPLLLDCLGLVLGHDLSNYIRASIARGPRGCRKTPLGREAQQTPSTALALAPAREDFKRPVEAGLERREVVAAFGDERNRAAPLGGTVQVRRSRA